MKCEKLLENQGSDKFFHFSKLEVSWQIHNYGYCRIMHLLQTLKLFKWHGYWMFICFIVSQNCLNMKGRRSFSVSKVNSYDLVEDRNVLKSLFVFLHPHTVMFSFRNSHLQWHSSKILHLKSYYHQLKGNAHPVCPQTIFRKSLSNLRGGPFASPFRGNHGLLPCHLGKRGDSIWR